jgi:hypothetical protein
MPSTIPELLRQFYFIEKHIKHLETMDTPATLLNAPSQPIKRVRVNVDDGRSHTSNCHPQRHVMAVLDLPESLADQVMLVCEQHRLYGRHGLRYEDSRIVHMADTEMSPGTRLTGREMHDFMSLLSEINRKWIADHPEDKNRPPDLSKAGKKNKKTKAKER